MKHASIFARLVANTYEPESENGCWLWSGYYLKSYKYAKIDLRINGKKISFQAHKMALVISELHSDATKDEILCCHMLLRLAKLQVNHLCCKSLCINPDHLELVTPKQNIEYRDRMRLTKKRTTSTIHTSQHETESTKCNTFKPSLVSF